MLSPSPFHSSARRIYGRKAFKCINSPVQSDALKAYLINGNILRLLLQEPILIHQPIITNLALHQLDTNTIQPARCRLHGAGSFRLPRAHRILGRLELFGILVHEPIEEMGECVL